jgi:putative sigma-54 modulation protein
MPLQITGRHVEVTAAQREYIDKKVNRLRKHCERIDEMAFTLGAEKLRHVVELNFRAGTIHAFTKVADENVMAAIDKAVDVVEVQIKKAKNKRNDKHADEVRSVLRVAATPLPEEDELEEA